MKHFTLTDGSGRAKCSYCTKVLDSTNITGPQRHLKSQHRAEYAKFEAEKLAMADAEKNKKAENNKKEKRTKMTLWDQR